MIHELIDPKKKTNRVSPSKNIKNQDLKTNFEETNFEASDSENKGTEASDFIPPWLKNSLGLNQRNNLSHAPPGSDQKPPKLSEKSKGPSQHEFEPLKNNTDADCGKKIAGTFDILLQDSNQEAIANRDLDVVEIGSNKTIPLYWNLSQKQSDTESSSNGDQKSVVASKMANEILTSADVEKLNEEEKIKLKFIKQKNKLKKRLIEDAKLSEFDKNEMNFLLEMKTREALDKYIKGDVQSITAEMRHLENKLLLYSTKHEMNTSKLNPQELRLLQDVKNKVGNVEELEKMLVQAKDINLKELVKTPEFPHRNYGDKKRDDKDEKSVKGSIQKSTGDEKSKAEKESLLSTDDEHDIKRFSEFLSNNKNLEEKRKCLEEVRNYFDKKRKSRLSKRRFMEEEKSRQNPEGEKKEDHPKDKIKSKEYFRGKKSKFALCDEGIVEKAVDEALQKFVELYHFRVSPNVMGNMKKNILQAIASNPLDSECCKINETLTSIAAKKPYLEKEREEKILYQEPEKLEQPSKEIAPLPKDVKKKVVKNVIETTIESSKDFEDIKESEKLRRLRKEFDNFLHSIQAYIDVTNLKLQSIILEKEEQTATSQNVQFVYNFTKKVLESEKADLRIFKAIESKVGKDVNTQTEPEIEPHKRNVKVQALELKSHCEQGLQTDEKLLLNRAAQTENEGVTIRELRDLKSCDVNPGLYRMVKSKEAGKFYLYPEEMESSQAEIFEKNYCPAERTSKNIKKCSTVNVLSKEGNKRRRATFKEKTTPVRLKKSKNGKGSASQLKTVDEGKKSAKASASDNSLNCLYFKNLEQQGSESSKREEELSDEAEPDHKEDPELDRDYEQDDEEKSDPKGFFWFWNGKKISPGCDLKTHVENLLKEKLKQITESEFQNHIGNRGDLSKSKKENESEPVLPDKISQDTYNLKNADAVFSFENSKEPLNKDPITFSDIAVEEIRPDEQKKKSSDCNILTSECDPQEKNVKNVGTQNSDLKLLSLNVSKVRTHSKILRGKIVKRNVVIKPARSRTSHLKKAEDIIKAVQVLGKTKYKMENQLKDNSSDLESVLDGSVSSSLSIKEADNPFSVMLDLKDSVETEEASNVEIKNALQRKKSNSQIDREVQYEKDDTQSVESQDNELAVDCNLRQFNLIENVLSRVSQRERENLWNDVRDLIKNKIGKDINDEGAREVCIEIEQDLHNKNKQGKKHAVLAKGHYTKNEGDVKVEIDLTLDDLARIVRQRQKKIRRRALQDQTKDFISSSSGQSDLTRDEIRRYQKYLHRFAAMGGDSVVQKNESKGFKKNKCN